MIQFKGFKPEAEERIARTMGYSGDMGGFATYLAQNPEKQSIMNNYRSMAMNMVKGGVVRKDYFLGGEAKAGVLPNFINPNTGQEYLNKNAAPNPSVLVDAKTQKPIEVKGDFYIADQDITDKLFDKDGYFGDPRRMRQDLEFDPATGTYKPFGQMPTNLSNMATSAMPNGPVDLDIKKLDFSAFQPKQAKLGSTTNLDELYYTDYDNPRSDEELRNMYTIAQAEAKAQRDSGFMGRVQLPGEMPFENFAEMNRYQVLPKVQPTEYERPKSFQGMPIDAPLSDSMKDFIAQGKRIDGRKMSNQELDNLEFSIGTDRGGGEFLNARDKNGVPVILTTEQKEYLASKNFTTANSPLSVVNNAVLPKNTSATQAEDGTGSAATPLQDQMAEQAYNPQLPYGGAVYAQGIGLQPQQFIPSGSGQLEGQVSADAAQADTFQAKAPTPTGPAQYDATQVSGAMAQQVAGVQAAQAGGLAPEATVSAATQTDSMVSQVTAAQGTGILMDNPAQRKVQSGELVTGAADAQTAAKFTEQIQAAQATPSKQATVAGQLETLLQQFEGGATPPWAAGAMRAATATLAARGLGASSMAGQAVVQAAMESALPVAQADAATRAAFEAQNLSNRQERAMLAAQQRAAFIGMEFDQAFQSRVMNASKISDIANMNFTADQQIALENSRIANTVNLQNLNNQQAVIMAEAAALSQLDMANLNNRQQAAVMNAQSFLSMDMANLNNRQQVAMFKAQAMQQALFTDQAAVNAAKQFNATSQMQTDQFFANLQTQTSQFNAAQANAQAQFNAGEENVISRFNTELRNQREQFNAKNRLIIDQNNVQWRREVATANTAAINRANEINAKSILDMSETAYNNLWQYYSDSMEYAWTSAENERDRLNRLAVIKLQGDIKADITDLQNDYNSSVAFGNLIGTFLTGGFKPLGSLFGGGS